MNKSIVFSLFILLIYSQNSFCQLKVTSSGHIGIATDVANSVLSVDGYGLTDIVGEKGDKLYIIEAKNGNRPHFTKFQSKAFPKMNNRVGIEFFGSNAKKFDLPTGLLTNYEFQIKRYHQYIFPLP